MHSSHFPYFSILQDFSIYPSWSLLTILALCWLKYFAIIPLILFKEPKLPYFFPHVFITETSSLVFTVLKPFFFFSSLFLTLYDPCHLSWVLLSHSQQQQNTRKEIFLGLGPHITWNEPSSVSSSFRARIPGLFLQAEYQSKVILLASVFRCYS